MRSEVYISIADAYFKQGRYELAAEKYREAIRNDPRNSLKPYEGLAEVYIKMEALEKAIKVWQTALKFFPDEPKIYYNLGSIYQDLDIQEMAIESYQKAVELDPANENSHFYLGEIYYEKGMIIESIREFQAVIYINKNNPDAYGMLGKAYLKVGEFEKGRKLLNQAIKLRESSNKK